MDWKKPISLAILSVFVVCMCPLSVFADTDGSDDSVNDVHYQDSPANFDEGDWEEEAIKLDGTGHPHVSYSTDKGYFELTLNGLNTEFDFSGNGFAIILPSDSHVVLVGNNHYSGNVNYGALIGSYYGSVTIEGKGSLTSSMTSTDPDSPFIRADAGNIAIRDCTLDFCYESATAGAIYCNHDFSLINCDIRIDCKTDDSRVFYLEGEMTSFVIDDSSVYFTTNGDIVNDPSYMSSVLKSNVKLFADTEYNAEHPRYKFDPSEIETYKTIAGTRTSPDYKYFVITGFLIGMAAILAYVNSRRD